jgi:L-asparagine transporter-like permease
MKKFLYLRIIAVITAAILVFFMFTTLMALYIQASNKSLWDLLMYEAFLLLFISHSTIILYLYKKHYPDIEIPGNTSFWYILSVIAGWLAVIFIIFIIIGMSFPTEKRHGQTNIDRGHLIVLIIISLLGILLIIQLSGAMRMVKTIQKNARQKLEDSFL